MEKNNMYGGKFTAYTREYQDFKDYLEKRGVSTSKFKPMGAVLNKKSTLPTMIDIICIDIEKSSAGKEKHIVISFANDDNLIDFMNIFDRVSIKFAHDKYDIDSLDIENRVIIDNTLDQQSYPID